MNRVVKFNEYGGAAVLKIETEAKVNTLKGKEVLVKMSAYALNRANVMFREGTYVYEADFPSRIGIEAAGVIENIGDEVANVKIGDRVSLIAPENESKDGYFADYNIVNEESLLPVAGSLSDLEAASCWVPYLTVYKNFVESGKIQKGSWVILPAASSSISLAANQVAKHLGAKTIGITRSSKKLSQLKEQGFDKVIVSEEENIEERVKEITGDGADYAFDPVGGKNLEKLVKSLKKGSDLTVYGALSGEMTELPIFSLMESQVKIDCYAVYDLFLDAERFQEAINYYLPLFEERKLVPIHDTNFFDFIDIVNGFRFLESNQQFGKVVISNE